MESTKPWLMVTLTRLRWAGVMMAEPSAAVGRYFASCTRPKRAVASKAEILAAGRDPAAGYALLAPVAERAIAKTLE